MGRRLGLVKLFGKGKIEMKDAWWVLVHFFVIQQQTPPKYLGQLGD
jgi:hypothetical protein